MEKQTESRNRSELEKEQQGKQSLDKGEESRREEGGGGVSISSRDWNHSYCVGEEDSDWSP